MKSFVKILVSALALGVMASGPMLRAQAEKAAPPAGGGQGQRGQRGAGGRGGMNPEQRIAAIDAAVTLTAEQKTKVTAILADAQKEMQAARGDGGGDRQAMMEKMQALQKKTNDAIKALLTPEQQKKFDAMPQAPAGGRRGQGGGGGAGGARRGGGN